MRLFAWPSRVIAGAVVLMAGLAAFDCPVSLAQDSSKPALPTATAAPGGATTVLTVGGDVPSPVTLSREELEKLPRAEVQGKDMDGKDAVFGGTPLADVLRAAGVKFDTAMPSRNEVASYVLVEAADGYKAVFALAEIDPGQTDRVILLANTKDGAPLSAGEGPWRIVAPGEKRPARWVRQVTAISVHKG